MSLESYDSNAVSSDMPPTRKRTGRGLTVVSPSDQILPPANLTVNISCNYVLWHVGRDDESI